MFAAQYSSLMKKIYFLFTFSIIARFASAQDFTPQNATLNVSGPANATLSAHADIYNSGSQTYEVMCAISDATMAAHHDKYFCFGDFCYNPGVLVSTVSTTMNAGESKVLSAYAIPNNVVGTDVITYQIYDQSGNSDTLSITFTYIFNEVGIDELSNSRYAVSVASPNPANNLTAISYNVPSGKDIRLVFRNLLGAEVKEIKLYDNRSTAIVPVADLVNGVYLYTLLVDGKATASKKLVVAHK
jgi:hypothetical protein